MARGEKHDAEYGDGDEMSGFDEAMSELRAEVPVRPQWRDSVLREVDALVVAQRSAHGGVRRWAIAPPTAAAAALLFAALGAVVTSAVYEARIGATRAGGTQRSETASAGAHGGAVERPRPVSFALVAPGATRVSLVGDFNGWDATATPMRPHGDDRLWMVDVALPPGRHVYAFVVDGDVTPDPAAPRAGGEDFGTPSSVVLVGMRGS